MREKEINRTENRIKELKTKVTELLEAQYDIIKNIKEVGVSNVEELNKMIESRKKQLADLSEESDAALTRLNMLIDEEMGKLNGFVV